MKPLGWFSGDSLPRVRECPRRGGLRCSFLFSQQRWCRRRSLCFFFRVVILLRPPGAQPPPVDGKKNRLRPSPSFASLFRLSLFLARTSLARAKESSISPLPFQRSTNLSIPPFCSSPSVARTGSSFPSFFPSLAHRKSSSVLIPSLFLAAGVLSSARFHGLTATPIRKGPPFLFFF